MLGRDSQPAETAPCRFKISLSTRLALELRLARV